MTFILEYIGLGIGFRVLIPAGSEISRFADDHGSVCIVCLAEYYGYKHIGADEVLRQPLSDFYKNDLIPGDLQY